MIKAEFFDLGPHNGMGEPDATGSYWAFTVRDLGQPGDEAQELTFLVPAHQLPTDHAQAETEAAVAAAYEDAADEVGQHLSTPEDVVWAKDAAERIRDRSNADALEAAKAEAQAEARQVKPLEWWRSDTGDLCCDTLVGRYQIQTGRERYFMMPAMSPGWGNRPDGDAVPSWHKSEESAKAAAQDDYERRVLSALISADQEGDQ